MANTNAPFGLRPLMAGGSAPTGFANWTRKNGILYNNATAIYSGDLVQTLSTGYLGQWTATTAASQCAGVFVGCERYSTSQNTKYYSPYWPGTDAASGTVDAFLIPIQQAANMMFVIQTDGTGITVADIGANADIVVGTGSTSGGCFSGSYLDTGTLNTTATLPLRIMDLWSNWCPVGPGTQAGAYNWAVVSINMTGQTGI